MSDKKKLLKRPRRGQAAPALRPLPMPHGVTFHARVMDAYERARVDAAVERDLNALIRDEETVYDWALPPEKIAVLASDMVVRKHFAEWMRLVVLATLSVERVEGFEADEDGAVAPSFDLFAALLEEGVFEDAFKRLSIMLMLSLDDEKNVSGAAPNGASAAALSIAAGVAPATTPRSGTHAHEDLPSKISTERSDAVPSTSTLPAPPQAPSPGGSPAAPAAGSPDSAG